MRDWKRGLGAIVLALGALVLVACGEPAAVTGADVAGVSRDAPAGTRTPSLYEATRTPVIWTATPVPTAVPQPAPWGAAPVALTDTYPAVSARAAVVMDEASGAVLYQKDGHLRLGPASLTKIATAVLAIESGDLDRWVDVDVDASSMPGSTLMGLRSGDQFTLRDLLYGLMLPSGNDAALAIGRAVAGSDAAFIAEMNGLAQRMGLSNTNFTNAHGLDWSEHYSSAYDLAVLARYAMSLEEFMPLASARSWTTNGSRTISLGTLNVMLGRYPSADGIKTGFTRSSGKTIVVSAVQDGRRVYVVLLDAPNREADATKLLDWAFANHRWE